VPHTACAKMLLPFTGPRPRKWGLLLKACAHGKCHERYPKLTPCQPISKDDGSHGSGVTEGTDMRISESRPRHDTGNLSLAPAFSTMRLLWTFAP
jgi:hypothetical protein